MRRTLITLVVAALAGVGLTVVAAPGSAVSTDVQVPATAGGPDNGGTAAVSIASGTIHICGESGCPNGPDGGNPGNSTSNSLVPSSPYGCLAARVGSGPWECIGVDGILDGPGEIQFGINDDFVSPGVGYEDNFGSFTVVVGMSMQRVSVTKRLVGDNPGVSFPVTVTCTSQPIEEVAVPTVHASNFAGDLVLGADTTASITLTLPPLVGNQIYTDGPPTIDVWWPVSGVENVTCTASESLAGLPAGATCTPSIVPQSAVLYDLNEEIDRSASFEVTNTCAVPLSLQPNFTG
jgi:hypothetical protein